MKKTMFLVALAVMFGGQVKAQDTLYRDTPLSNYYWTYWPDTTNMGFARYLYECSLITAKRYITEDTLTVYGIAASMVTFRYNEFPGYPTPDWMKDTAEYLLQHYKDTSTKHTEESLLLYQYSGNASSRMQLIGDSLPVHAIDTPVSYYLQTDIFEGIYRGDSCFRGALPVYERYFTVPQVVHDTFYTGFTHNCYGFGSDSIQWVPKHPEVNMIAFGEPEVYTPAESQVATYRLYHPSGTPLWEYHNNSDAVYFIFPILTPKPVEEPVGVFRMPEWERYVSLSPNPAQERVEVFSSFGMSSIEVYDGGGRKVHEQQASGYKAILDVHGWAAGTYLLRIATPMGTTTKKLLVR